MMKTKKKVEDPTTLPRLSEIVTHLRAHLDEVAAIWLVLTFGNGRKWYWPETRPRVVYCRSHEEAEARLLNPEAIGIGIGHGPYDEHKVEGRLPNTCSAMLVAEDLRISQRPSLKLILEEVLRSDIRPGQLHLEMGQVVKALNSYGWEHISNEKARAAHTLAFVMAVLDAKMREAKEFMLKCPKEFERRGASLPIGGLRVGFVDSDYEKMNAFLRSQGHDIIIQRSRKTRNMMIFCTEPYKDTVIPEIARGIVKAEAKLAKASKEERKANLKAFDRMVRLKKGRELPGCKHWYYHLMAGMVFNGSLTHPDVTPTKLEPADLRDIVVAAVAAAEDRLTAMPQTATEMPQVEVVGSETSEPAPESAPAADAPQEAKTGDDTPKSQAATE